MVPPPPGMCPWVAAGGAVNPPWDGKPPPLLSAPAAARGWCPPAPWKLAGLTPPLPLLEAPTPGSGGEVPTASAPPPPRLEPPTPCDAEPRSRSLIGFGAWASPTSKPFARAQLRASPPTPSRSRIFCVAAIILSTESRLAFPASALQRICTACISASFAGSGLFDARMLLISLLPVVAMSDNRLRA